MRKFAAAMLGTQLVEQWPDAVLLTDARGTIEYVNPAFERLTGYRASEVLGHTPAVVKSGKHDARFYRRLWSQLRAGRVFRGVFLNRRKNGELFHEEELIRPLRASDGRITHFLCAGRDVSAFMRELGRLERLATHDPLTGLPNRNLYADRLAQALRNAERRGEPLVVAMFDLDDFKRINTHHGHSAGDAVLKAVARRTRRCMRAIDTVARVGGDEFALVLPVAGARRSAATVLEKVRAANAVPVRYGRLRIPMSISIGATLYPRHGRTAAALRKRADVAMYLAKRAGGNCYRFSNYDSGS
jgi:diguanylate cyclase (GGDEF)-like protein/PAS domain S-box-containing protein